MDIEWTRVKRRPDWPWWSIFLPVLWLALGGANLLLAAAANRPVTLCLFKRLTARPCPTCGFTRGALLFLSGHPIQGWLCNPLLFSFLGAFAILVGIRVLRARQPVVRLSGRQRRAAWIVVSTLVAMNWLYVIRYVG